MSNILSQIHAWHHAARPAPSGRDFNAQLGCHFEEIVEMLDALDINTGDAKEAMFWLDKLARKLKTQAVTATVRDRRGLLDSLCDQIVTGVGVGHCADVNVVRGCDVVNTSNWSKFVNGQPVRDEGGKIIKGPMYQAPDLTGLF